MESPTVMDGTVDKEERSNREHRHRRKVVMRSCVGAYQSGHSIAFRKWDHACRTMQSVLTYLSDSK